jgi:uncharacterized membrane protein
MSRPPRSVTAVEADPDTAGQPSPEEGGPGRILSPRRALISLAVGAASGTVAALCGEPILMPLVGWTVASATALVWVWRISWRQGPRGTKLLAEAESRFHSTDSWVMFAAIGSLAAVVMAEIRSSSRQDSIAVALTLLSVLAVILSWALVNTVFALKYARLYYVDEPDSGGIEFRCTDPPTYADFAYLAFTIGMTFQVSDTDLTAKRVRRDALHHALLSYLFGTVIVAITVSSAAGLLRG